MSSTSTAALPSRAVYTTEPIFRLTVDQYHELIRSGVLSDDDPVELLEGILVCKMTKYPPHAASTALTRRAIESLLVEGWHYRTQDPVTLADGEPEPNGTVARGEIGDYSARHPGPSDVALVIEVADTSLSRDRGIKLRSYARAGIAEYWIVNLNDRQIERYREPVTRSGVPTYADSTVYGESERIPFVLAGQPLGEVNVIAVLPTRRA